MVTNEPTTKKQLLDLLGDWEKLACRLPVQARSELVRLGRSLEQLKGCTQSILLTTEQNVEPSRIGLQQR